MAAVHQQTLDWIRELSAIERPSASRGERRAAEWIVAQLAENGTPARIEVESAHGTHLPFILPSAVALAAGFVRPRRLAIAMAALATAAIADELEGHRRALRRSLARRRTWNVVAELGDPRAPRTVVLVSHHDAARPWAEAFGTLASAPPPRWLGRRALPLARTIVYAPLIVLLGLATRSRWLRRAGMAASALVALVFGDVTRRAPVPGANDNASGVAALLGVASDLADDPAPSLRVVLLSTGAEETMLEGMDAFLRRHASDLDPSRTLVVCLDMLGWDRLVMPRSQGVLRRHRSRSEDLDRGRQAAKAANVELATSPGYSVPTDALAARWKGLPTLFITSAARDGAKPHYHRSTDVPENVEIETVVAARRLCTQLISG